MHSLRIQPNQALQSYVRHIEVPGNGEGHCECVVVAECYSNWFMAVFF